MSKITGIYAIRHIVSNKLYIGSALNAHERWNKEHIPALKNNKHYNVHLQNAWNKYGETSFVFEIVEECQEDQLDGKEGFWIEHYKSWNRDFGYNLTRFVEGRKVVSQETKLKIAKANWTNSIPYDEAQKLILELHHQGLGKNTIARKLKITRNAVYTCLELHGLHKNEGKGSIVKLTSTKKKEVVELRQKGVSWNDISTATGISRTQLYRALAIKDGSYGGNHKRRKSYVKLTPEIEQIAVELRNTGMSWKEIGSILDVDRAIFYQRGLAKKQQGHVRKIVSSGDKQKMRDLKHQGHTLKEISKLTGFSYGSVQRAVCQ